MKFKTAAIAAVALLAVASAAPAKAEPAAGLTVTCPLTGPGIVACVAAGVVLHELGQINNGKEGFGRNGEIMKILRKPAGGQNSEARKAGRFLDPGNRKGLFGGPNSVFRKPLG